MKIERISRDFTPLCEGILYNIETESEEPTDIEVEVIEMATGEVVATKLLRNTARATINIAPYMEILAEYAPSSHQQTSLAEAPTAAYKIRIGDIESEEVVVSVNRCKIGSTPCVVTSFPISRQLRQGESDEVLIVAGRGKTIYTEIVADTGEVLYLEHLTSSGAATLTIVADDFESAVGSFDVATRCEGKTLASLHYEVKPPLKTVTRMAWLSECGAIEQYSFPVTYKAKLHTKRQTFATAEGFAAQGQTRQQISLCSRLEPRATIEALAQIASSPKAWVENEGKWHSVEVITPEVEYNLFGEPSFIHLDICLWQREVGLW